MSAEMRRRQRVDGNLLICAAKLPVRLGARERVLMVQQLSHLLKPCFNPPFRTSVPDRRPRR
jgi:hypothetical protein